MKKLIFCLLLVLAIALPASAKTYYNGGFVYPVMGNVSHDRFFVVNSSTVNIGNGVTVTLTRSETYNTSYVASMMQVGPYSDLGPGYLNLTGSGQILFDQEMSLGTSDGTSIGVVTMSGTSFMNPARLFLGNRGDSIFSITDDATLAVRTDGTQYGPGFLVGQPHYGYTFTSTFNQSGNASVLDPGSALDLGGSNTGIYNMSGGLLRLGGGINIGGTDDAFNYSGGTIIMTGNQIGTLATLNDMTGGAVEVFDGTNTTIIPEPATLLLLGLGGLLLRRRR